jgi:hypothetical protein
MECQEKVRILRRSNAHLNERLRSGKAHELLFVIQSLTDAIEAGREKLERLRMQFQKGKEGSKRVKFVKKIVKRKVVKKVKDEE